MSDQPKDLKFPRSVKGWIKATPLEHYSSLHELFLMGLLGTDLKWPDKKFFLQLNLNLHTPLKIHPQAYLTFHTIDDTNPPSSPDCCFSITQFKRWRIDLKPYSSFDDYLNSLKRWHHCNYVKSKKMFDSYGCTVTFSDGDWSEHVADVYKLYYNVALRHGEKLYDIRFFQDAAKRDDYKLICAWFEGKLIAMFVLQDEVPTMHSICCGMDYEHSSPSYAYSWLHYAWLEHVIAQKKYETVDVGLTADDAKKMIGFEPILSRMDIYTKSNITRAFLRFASKFITARITPEGHTKLGIKFYS